MRLHIKWPAPLLLTGLIQFQPSTSASSACRQNKMPSHNPFKARAVELKASVLAYQPISARPQGVESRFYGLFWIYKPESNSWSGDVAAPGTAPAVQRCRYVHARSRGDRPTPSPLSLNYIHFSGFLKQLVCPVWFYYSFTEALFWLNWYENCAVIGYLVCGVQTWLNFLCKSFITMTYFLIGMSYLVTNTKFVNVVGISRLFVIKVQF